MANAVKEDVARAIKAVLLLINGTAPQTFTAAVVRPSRMDNVTPADSLLVLSQSEDDRVLGFTDGNVCWRDIAVVYSIDCFCFPNPDSNADAIDMTRNEREADIIIALMADPSLGGLVFKTSRCIETQWWDYTEFCGFTVRFEAHIRHKDNDPRVNGVS